MQLTVIRCDRCGAETRNKGKRGWSKLRFHLIKRKAMDLCPGCLEKVKAGIAELLLDKPSSVFVPRMESIKVTEQRHVVGVLTATSWDKARAASILGIQRSTLDRKLKLYKASRPEVASE